MPGSIPGPATCGWASAHPGLISLDRRVRLPDPLLDRGRVRKQAKRRGREPRDFAGSIPASVTDTIPWSSGKDAWMTPRKSAVRFCPGSLKRRSVGVVAAHVLGKDETGFNPGRISTIPDGPLDRTGCSFNGQDAWLAPRSVRWVRLPAVHWKTRAHGPTGRHRPGVAEIPVRLWVGPLKRTEGSRIRLAGPHC